MMITAGWLLGSALAASAPAVLAATPLGAYWATSRPRGELANSRGKLLEGLNGEIFWVRTEGKHFTVSAFKNDGSILWEMSYPARGRDWLRKAILMPDGGLLLVGSTGGYVGASMEGRAVRIRPEGELAWDLVLTGDAEDYLETAVVLPDGDILLGGTSASSHLGRPPDEEAAHADYWITRVRADGVLRWQRFFGGTSAESLTDMALAGDGTVWVVGNSVSEVSGDRTSPSNGLRDMWVLHLEATGVVLWDRALGGSGLETAGGVVPIHNGALVHGWSTSGPDGNRTAPAMNGDQGDFWLVKVGTAGNVSWDAAADVGIPQVVTARDGSLLVAGHRQHAALTVTSDPWRVLRVNPAGDLLWRTELGGFSGGIGGIIEDAEGNTIVAGLAGHESDHWTLFNLGVEGSLRWTKQARLPAEFGDHRLHEVHAVLSTRAGTLVLCGSGLGGGGGLAWILAIHGEFVGATEDPPRMVALPEFTREPASSGPWFSLVGWEDFDYVIEASPDMRDWTAIATNHVGATDIKFRDPSGGASAARIYRARRFERDRN